MVEITARVVKGVFINRKENSFFICRSWGHHTIPIRHKIKKALLSIAMMIKIKEEIYLPVLRNYQKVFTIYFFHHILAYHRHNQSSVFQFFHSDTKHLCNLHTLEHMSDRFFLHLQSIVPQVFADDVLQLQRITLRRKSGVGGISIITGLSSPLTLSQYH